MHKLIEYVCDELDELERKAEKDGKLSMAEVQYMDTLAHTKKNLLKADEMMEEGEYSMAGDRGVRSYVRGGRSYARGRNARRDSMGRYSREGYSMNDDIADRLRDLMEDAPDSKPITVIRPGSPPKAAMFSLIHCRAAI